MVRQELTDEATENLDKGLWDRLHPLVVEPVQTEPPEVERVGLGYRAHFDSAGIDMQLSRIRESRYEIHGELMVSFAATAPVFDRHLFAARVNLSSVSARGTTARSLDQRFKADWAGMLDRFFVAVLDLERKPEVLEEIGMRTIKEPDRWILKPLLLKGKTTIIFGPGGSWKSTLGAAIAVSLTTGDPVIPDWVGMTSRTLILDWEDDSDVWNERIRAIAVGAGLGPPVVLYQRMTRPLADQLEQVSALVAEHQIEALIVDSVGMAIGATNEGEGVADGAFRLFAALRQLGTTNLLIDHVAGADLGTGGSVKPYGSIYKVNLARSVFEVRRPKEIHGDRAEFILAQSKTNGIRVLPQELAVIHGEGTIQFERGRVGSPELQASLPLRERMARALGENGAMTTEALAEYLQVSAAAIRTLVGRDERFVRFPKDGRIGLVLRGAHP
jgi:hypothetical protein